MNTSRFSAGASRFAHFAGLSRKSRAAEDDEQEDQPKGKKGRAAEGDDDDDADDAPKGKRGKAKGAEDDDQDDDAPKGKKGRAASDEDDDDADAPKGKRSKAKGTEDDDEDEDEPKGKKSKRAAEDDDDDADEDDDKEELNGRSAKASARRREQARIAHILGHKAAANNLPLALSLACETRMSRSEAVRVLAGQAGRRDVRDEDEPANPHARADRARRNVNLSSDAEPVTGKKALDASWGSAFEKAGIKVR